MIKQMSLIALGAATLFMAPTVVHADNVRDTKEPEANITITDNGENKILSAPTFDFESLSNQSGSRTVLKSDKELKVQINKSDKAWKVTARRDSFTRTVPENSGYSTRSIEWDKLILSENGVTIDSPSLNEKPSYTRDTKIEKDYSTEILSADGHSVGTHTVKIPKESVELSVPMYYPAGDYTSTITWEMTDTP